MKSLFDSIHIYDNHKYPVSYDVKSESLNGWHTQTYEGQSFGTITIGESHSRYYTLWKLQASIHHPVHLGITRKLPLFGLIFNADADHLITLTKEDPAWGLASHHYNFICLQFVDGLIEIRSSSVLLIIRFSMNYMRQWQEEFPALANAIRTQRSSAKLIKVFEEDLVVSQRMKIILQAIQQNQYSGTSKRMFIDTKVQELLLYALQNHSGPSAITELRTDDARKMSDAHFYITQHLSANISLKSLAQEVGINTFKLKKGFKQIYGVTVFHFLREERMKLANHLIEGTELTIEEISFECGYKNLSNFTIAFKRRYGYPPSYIRRRRL